LHGGICQNDAVTNTRGLVLQNVPLSARQSSLERSMPLRAWLATDTHRSRSPDHLRLTDFYRRSNPHRSATLLIGISTSPRFPPWRLVQHLPPSLTGLDASARTSRCRTTLNPTRFLGRSPDTATAEDLRRYQLHCVDRGISAVTLNATITGLKFLFEATLGQPELMARMHPVRMSRTLPIILSREEVSR